MHNRREISTGMTANIAGLALTTILVHPKLAHAAASLLERHSMKLTHGKTVNAYLGVPKRTPAPAVVLLHEWWA